MIKIRGVRILDRNTGPTLIVPMVPTAKITLGLYIYIYFA